jgi:hypothetical protein
MDKEARRLPEIGHVAASERAPMENSAGHWHDMQLNSGAAFGRGQRLSEAGGETFHAHRQRCLGSECGYRRTSLIERFMSCHGGAMRP